MPAKRIPWFKFWIGATAHGKVRQLDDGVFRTWVELLDAAAQQPIRGRFASRAEAAAVLRRPVKHLTVLINAGLIDEDPDKHLTMHDWDDWQRWRQEDTNDAPSTPEGPTNDSRTTTERQRIDSSTTTEAPVIDERTTAERASRAAERAKKKEERREKEDIDGTAAVPAGQPPQLMTVPKTDRNAEVIDALRAIGMETSLTGRDHSAIKIAKNMAPALIAELYGRIYRGEYGDAYMQQNLSVYLVIEKMPGYLAFKANGPPRPVLVGRNGYAERPRRIVDHTGCPPGCPSTHPEQAS